VPLKTKTKNTPPAVMLAFRTGAGKMAKGNSHSKPIRHTMMIDENLCIDIPTPVTEPAA
jgi:hypothetical protein